MGGTLPVGLSCLGIELLMALSAFPVSGRQDRHHRVARPGGLGGPRVCPAVKSVTGLAEGAPRRQDPSSIAWSRYPVKGGRAVLRRLPYCADTPRGIRLPSQSSSAHQTPIHSSGRWWSA